MNRAKKIANDFYKELRRTKTKFLHAGYPVKFINDTFFKFNEEKKELLIPKWLFDQTKLVVTRLPFTNVKIRFNIIWNTRKMQSLFNNKDKV